MRNNNESEENNGSIKNYSKSKGYESLPRELLQSEELPLEAIGLLCSLQSLPENWVIKKTNLHKRFLNKKSSIDRIWNLLVENGYVIQFRKRVQKKYDYQYFFNLNKFSFEETQELFKDMAAKGYLLYHKKFIKGVKNQNEILNVVCLSNEEKQNLDISFWNFKKQSVENSCKTNVSWTFDFENPNLESSKPAASKLTNNKLTNRSLRTVEEERKEINKKGSDTPKSEKVKTARVVQAIDVMSNNSDLLDTAKYLLSQNAPAEDVDEIILFLDENREYLERTLIQSQAARNRNESDKNGLYSYFQFFVNGLKKFAATSKIRFNKDAEDEYLQEISLPRVSLYNWLEGEELNLR